MLEVMKRQDAREARRDEMHAKEREEREKREREERKERDDAWRNFLSDQRESYNTGISRIAEEVKGLSEKVTIMNQTLTAHDISSREARNRAVDRK